MKFSLFTSFLLIALVAIVSASVGNAEDPAPAQTCSALNAATQMNFDAHDVGNYMRHNIGDAYPLNDDQQTVIASHYWSAIDQTEQVITSHGSSIMRYTFTESRSNRTATVQYLDEKEARDAHTKLNSHRTQIFGISNPTTVNRKDADPKNNEKLMLASYIVPYVDDAEAGIHKSKVRIAPFNPLETAKSNRNITVPETFLFSYSLPQHNNKEPALDINGNMLPEDKWVDIASNALANTIDTTVASRQQLSVRALRYPNKAPNTTVDFIVLANTVNSIKLIKYSMDINDPTVAVQQKAAIIMPRIEGIDTRAVMMGAFVSVCHNPALGGIYIALPVHRSQRTAFAAWTKKTIDFPDNVEQTFFLLKFNRDLELKTLAPLNTLGANNFVITSFMHEGNMLLISGFDRHPHDINVDFKSFVARVTLDEATHEIVNKIDAFYLDGVTTEEEKKKDADTRFTALAINFALDDSADKVVIGGRIGSFKTPLVHKARVYLAQLDATNKKVNVVYTMNAGDPTSSSAIRQVIATEVSDPSKNAIILGLTTGMPTGEEFTQDSTASFWNLDCSQVNKGLESAITILFFVCFGIVVASLALTTVYYGIMAVVLALRARRAASPVTYSKI